jgi:hypothetical protein
MNVHRCRTSHHGKPESFLWWLFLNLAELQDKSMFCGKSRNFTGERRFTGERTEDKE